MLVLFLMITDDCYYHNAYTNHHYHDYDHCHDVDDYHFHDVVDDDNDDNGYYLMSIKVIDY